MSEKVTPLYPEQARKRRLRRRLLALLGTLAVVLAAVLVILFRQELNFDRIRRYFAYMGAKGSDSYGTYSFEAHNANVGAAFGDGLAVASVAGLRVYNAGGEPIGAVPNTLRAPALAVGENLAAAWDVGGTVLSVVSADGVTVQDLTAGGALLDVSFSGDYLCRAEAGGGYKTVLTVQDATMREIYQWYSSSQYLPLCAVSDDGTLLAAVALGQSGGAFESSLVLLPTDQEAPSATVSLGNELILELAVLPGKRICAVGEASIRLFDETGALLGAYDYGGGFLVDFSLSGDGFAALALNRHQAGDQCSVVTVDPQGSVTGEVYLGTEVLSVSAAGKYLAVLTADRLTVYQDNLTPYAETDDVAGVSQVAMRRDGTVLRIGTGSARLYLP